MREKIVVTGSAGFIGKNLCVKLSEIGFEVLGVDLTKTGDDRFKEIEMNFFSNEINRFLDENSILIHLAAISTDSESKKSPLKAIDINIAGTQKLMEICKDKKISKFIFASSEWVYPENSIAIPQFETDILSTRNLNSVYALTKLMSEDFIRVNSDNLNYSILRFGIVYGPRKTPGSSLESLALKVWQDQRIEIGSSLTARNFIYVEDLISGIIQSIELSKSKEIYNLSGDNLINLGNIIDATSDILSRSNKYIETGQVPSIRNPINTKARTDLFWEPKKSLEQGIRSCLKMMTGEKI